MLGDWAVKRMKVATHHTQARPSLYRSYAEKRFCAMRDLLKALKVFEDGDGKLLISPDHAYFQNMHSQYVILTLFSDKKDMRKAYKFLLHFDLLLIH